ncbi:hypothetical protein [Halovivax sp.]|uniref:hypothetical protein n=1 Tax=Halovivax sp. TaxID=1935978 RepID=UPI0025C5CA1F|nr:hypothetical protein [Halovivax sp.]
MDERVGRYVRRAESVLASEPPTAAATTREWLVDPLLAALGWDDDAREHDVAVRGVELAALLRAGEDGTTPAVYVAVEPADRTLRGGAERQLLELMAATGVDRAIYTTGREFVFLAGDRGADRLAVDLESLPDHVGSLSHFTRERLDRRLARSTAREVSARRLAVRRDDVAARVADLVAETAGDIGTRTLLDDAGRFVDDVVRSLGADSPVNREHATASPDHDGRCEDGPGVPSDGGRTDSVAGGASTDAPSPGPPSGRAMDTGASDSASARGDASTSEQAAADASADQGPPDENPPADRVPPADDVEGEFVVRFFTDRGSIGAVGHSTSAGALAEATEYCFERGLRGVRIPWGPDDGDVVLGDDPVDEDGSRWAAYERLENGLYVNTSGSVADRAERVQELVSRAGLRAMLSGDWDGSAR